MKHRTFTLAAALAVAVVAPAVAAPAAGSRPSKQYTIEQFMTTTNLRGASFSKDESRILLSSDKTGVFNVWTVPVAGGEPTPVTQSTTDSTYAVAYFKNDDRVLYRRDQGGNENDHLYVKGSDGAERDLTPGDKLKAAFHGFSRDGKSFWVSTNERDPKFFDLYRYDATSYERSRVFQNDQAYEIGVISGDGRWIALQKPDGNANDDIYLHDTRDASTKLISKHTGRARYDAADFDADAKHLYYLTNDGSEFIRVRRHNLATGAAEDVERADWDILYTTFSENGRYRVTGINADGTTVIKLYEHATGKEIPLPRLPDGEITSVGISPSETRMVFYVNGDRSPSNLYVLTLGADMGVKRLTSSLSPDIDPEDLVEAQVVRFKSSDGMSIPNIMYKPHQATPATKAPALVWVHGGPGGQTRRGYSALIQYLVNHGYVVLGINNRGSSGYGQSFYVADDRKHGKEPLRDCVEAKAHLSSLPYVDPQRIGIIGGSYGGYMVLAALAYHPDVFNAGVDLFGVSNWVRTLESIPPYWESFRTALYEEIGDPAKEKEMLKEISPLFHADKIRKPLMVLQGANDPRVIKPESDDIVAAVKKNNVPVEYVVFDDEGHGFTKKKNQIDGYGAMLKFLDEHLKGTAAAGAEAAGSN
ncbi:MAG: S9 family peptidase [Candidatus Polarisedimenticolia bacterium]